MIKPRLLLLPLILFAGFSVAVAQNSNQYPPNPLDDISQEITKISKSLEAFNKNMKDFMQRFALNQGNQLSEKQQKIIFGFQILNKAEERLAVLQKFQIELTEKEGSVKTRLAQVEIEMRPESIDRSVAFVGTTQTEELRESRRQSLGTERTSLSGLLMQIRRNLAETAGELRQTEIFVQNLRKKILPLIEIEISDL